MFLAEQEEHDEVDVPNAAGQGIYRSEDSDKCLEDLMEVNQIFPEERISKRRQEVETTAPQTVKAVQIKPQEHVQKRTEKADCRHPSASDHR